jgi:hypothetical protein
MPTYSNPLYANGVPTYSNEVGALADVFKSLAPNPLRDLQIQGYASNARLHQLQGDVIQNQQGGLSRVANALRGNNYQEIGPAAIESGNLQYLDNIYKAAPAQLAMRGLVPGQPALSDAEQQAVATAVGATGGNVANTFYGYDRTADEVHRNNNLESSDRRYGSDASAAASRYGADQQANVGYDRNRRYSTAEANTNTENARWHNLQNSALLDKNDVDYDVGMDRNQKGLEGTQFTSNNTLTGTKYTADRNLEGKQFDTLNDQRKTAAGQGATIDPAKLDEAVIQSVPGSFKDDKGHWFTDPSVTAADLQEVRTRTAHYLRQDPRDQYGAIQRSVSEVFGNAPSVTPAQEPWYAPNTPAQVNSLPAAQRPPLPNLAQQFAAPPAAAPVQPVPGAGPAPAAAPPADATLAKAAQTAKVPGANRQGIIQKLMSLGYTAQQIQQAGI